MTTLDRARASLGAVALLAACGGAATLPPTVPPAPRSPPNAGAARGPLDMTVREDGDASLVPSPSAELARAMAAYDAGELAAAALQLQSIVEGSTGASRQDAQAAQLWLAKALVKMGFVLSGLAVIDEIVQSDAHPFRARAVLWLSPIALVLPDAAGVAERAGGLSEPELSRETAGQSDDLVAHLHYLRGRASYMQSDFDPAIRSLAAVPDGLPWSNAARFLEVGAHVRIRHARPAVATLRRVFAAVDADPSAPDAARDRDLAWLALGRIYFTASHDEGRGQLIADAVAAYEHVRRDGPYADEALFEEAWSFEAAGAMPRALAALDALSTSFVERTAEVGTLRALVRWRRCEIDEALRATEWVVSSFAPRLTALTEYLRALPDDPAGVVAALAHVEDAGSTVPASIRGLLGRIAREPAVTRSIAQAARADREEVALAALPLSFRSSAIGARILDDLSIVKALALDNAAATVRGRVLRWSDETSALVAEAQSAAAELPALRATCRP